MEYGEFLSLLEKGEVYTHAGMFHADDVCCTALINLICDKEDIPRPEVHRVSEVTDEMREYLVYDIGRGEFDHHQRDNGTHEDGTPYASFGKIWDVVGETVSGWYGGEKTMQGFTEAFVKPIDRCDNSREDNFFSALIRSENPNWNEEDTRFDAAVQVAEEGIAVRLEEAASVDSPGYVLSDDANAWVAARDSAMETLSEEEFNDWLERNPDPKEEVHDLVGMYDNRDKAPDADQKQYARTDMELTEYDNRAEARAQAIEQAPVEIEKQLGNKTEVQFEGRTFEIIHLDRPSYPAECIGDVTRKNPNIVAYTLPSRGAYTMVFTGEWRGDRSTGQEGLLAPERWRGASKLEVPGMTFCHASGGLMAFKEKECAAEAVKVILTETAPEKFEALSERAQTKYEALMEAAAKDDTEAKSEIKASFAQLCDSLVEAGKADHEEMEELKADFSKAVDEGNTYEAYSDLCSVQEKAGEEEADAIESISNDIESAMPEVDVDADDDPVC